MVSIIIFGSSFNCCCPYRLSNLIKYIFCLEVKFLRRIHHHSLFFFSSGTVNPHQSFNSSKLYVLKSGSPIQNLSCLNASFSKSLMYLNIISASALLIDLPLEIAVQAFMACHCLRSNDLLPLLSPKYKPASLAAILNSLTTLLTRPKIYQVPSWLKSISLKFKYLLTAPSLFDGRYSFSSESIIPLLIISVKWWIASPNLLVFLNTTFLPGK